jgi:hypothetical protein
LCSRRPHQNQGWANYQSTEAAGPKQWINLVGNQEALDRPPFKNFNNRWRVINVYGHTNLWMIVPFVYFRTSLLDMMNVC